MKIVTYNQKNKQFVGLISKKLVTPIFEYTNQNIADIIYSNNFKIDDAKMVSLNDIELIAPIPNPVSLRDAYAFRQHVEISRKNRGLKMIPEYDKFPIFYYSNHSSITGPGIVYVRLSVL